MGDLKQIGQVSIETGLSLRTIRYYEEVELVVPTERTVGGFRLYSEADIRRLELVKMMKPLDLSLTEMSTLIESIEQPTASRKSLEGARQLLIERCELLRKQLKSAEALVATIGEAVPDSRQP